MAVELDPTYRFILTDRTSDVTRFANPVWKDDLALEYAREQGQQFFRTKMSGKLTFVGEDANWIVNRGYTHEIEVLMQRSNDMGSTWADNWTGHFYMTDCEVNLDDSQVVVQPTVDDDYNKILAAYDKEFNLVDLKPEMDYVHIKKFPLIQIYYPGESVLSCIYNGMSWEQDVDSETSDTVLTEDYHFAKNSNEREITIMIGGVRFGVYDADVTVDEYSSYQVDYYPIDGGSGTYLYINYYRHINPDLDIFVYELTIELRNGGTEQALYIYEESGLGSKDTSNLEFTMNEVGGSGTAEGMTLTRAIYARILLDVDIFDGNETAPLSSGDFCHDNRNYSRAIGFVLAARYLVVSAQTQTDPTEWGKSSNGQYFIEPTASDDIYPIARTSWENTSVWFLNDGNFISYMRSVGTKTMVLRTAYLLWSVIDVLLDAIDPTISHGNTTDYSQFLYSSTNPISSVSKKTLLITPKSNILAGEYSQPATKAPITLKNIMDMLRDVYDCYWHIENHKLRIEHIKWYRNGGSYSVAPSVGIDLTAMMMTRNGEPWSFHTSKYKYDKDQMPQTFQYGWMDEVTEAFNGQSIEVLSPYVDQGQIEEVRVSTFTSDIDYLLLNPGEISKDGFAIMAGNYSSGHYTLRVIELPNGWAPWVDKYLYLQNGDLAFCVLQPYYLCYNMPARSIKVNGNTSSAPGVKRTKSQEVRVPCYGEPNLLKLVKTGLGNGYVDKMTMVLTSRVAKTVLKYDMEDGEPVPPTPSVLLYRVGMVSDVHFDVNESTPTYYEQDVSNAISFFGQHGCLFVAGAGDMSTYSNNDLQNCYDYWSQVGNGMRLLTCLGNHDVLQVYGDERDRYGSYKVINYAYRLATDQYRTNYPICEPDGTKWDWFEERNGDTRMKDGQAYWDVALHHGPFALMGSDADIHFCAYADGHADVTTYYQGNYYPAGRDYGICMASKTSYYWQHPETGDIFVFLSINYGVNHYGNSWYVHATNLLTYNAYDQQLESFVREDANTPYERTNFDYQFYDSRALIWLKQVLEENQQRRVFIFSHLPFPSKAGNGKSVGGTGFYYTKNGIRPVYGGNEGRANDLAGLQMFFLNRLNRLYMNAVWFTGHTHFIFSDEQYDPYLVFCDKEFNILIPTQQQSQTAYSEQDTVPAFYTRLSDTPVGTCAMNVHLPSLSRPTTLASGVETRLSSASEGALLEVYNDCVKVHCVRFRQEGSSVYENEIVKTVTLQL